MKYLLLSLLLVGSVNASDIISQHNEQHAAEQAAREQLKSTGCAWTNVKRLERFRLVHYKESILIFGKQLLVECVERTAVITWDSPESPEKIKAYEIYSNNDLLASVPGKARSAEINLPLGSYNFHVVSVGYNEQRSSKSNTAELRLVNK